MKKILTILLCGVFMVSLSGCGGEKVVYKDIYAVVEEYSSLSKSTKYYEDYTYDEVTGFITGYTSYTISDGKTSKQNKENHTLEYDTNGNLLVDLIDKGSYYGTETDTYTYNSDNTLATLSYSTSNENNVNNGKKFVYSYEKNDLDQVIKCTELNEASSEYQMIYTYEYDEEGMVVTETQTSTSSTYKIIYEYDENDNKIKETVYKGDSSVASWTVTYKYEIIGTYAEK